MLAEPYRSVIARRWKRTLPPGSSRLWRCGSIAAAGRAGQQARPLPSGLGGVARPAAGAAGANGNGGVNGRHVPSPPFRWRDGRGGAGAPRGFTSSWRACPGLEHAQHAHPHYPDRPGIIGFIMTANCLIPLGVICLLAYGVYRIIRAIVLAAALQDQAGASPPRPPAAAETSGPRPRRGPFGANTTGGSAPRRGPGRAVLKPARERFTICWARCSSDRWSRHHVSGLVFAAAVRNEVLRPSNAAGSAGRHRGQLGGDGASKLWEGRKATRGCGGSC